MDRFLTFRVRKSWLKVGLVTVLLVAVLAPVTGVASHTFTDVFDTNVHHDNVTWLADAGVTLGCNPPANDQYCPSDPVKRDQMATFMRRLAENQVVDAGWLDGLDSTAFALSDHSHADIFGFATGGAAVTTTSDTFADISGASVTVTIPSGESAYIVARFTGESQCTGGDGANDWCVVRLLVDGIEMNPVVGTDFAFDSTNDAGDVDGSWEGHSVARISDLLPAGTYTITAQWAVEGDSPSFRLDDWLLTAEGKRS